MRVTDETPLTEAVNAVTVEHWGIRLLGPPGADERTRDRVVWEVSPYERTRDRQDRSEDDEYFDVSLPAKGRWSVNLHLKAGEEILMIMGCFDQPEVITIEAELIEGAVHWTVILKGNLAAELGIPEHDNHSDPHDLQTVGTVFAFLATKLAR